MSTAGIAAVFLETHNWGRTAKFFQTLGFELEFTTDHESGQLRGADGPPVFVAEVPQSQQLRAPQLVVVVPADFQPDGTPFEETHYGTRETTVQDPDGRSWILRAGN
jgi:hypothetical protein